jgi:putative FmdB family regulatory protein
MPIYEYRCDNGHTFEVMQRMTDDPVASCQTCEAPVQRVFHPIAVHFKGSGFYNTDYGTRKRQRETAAAAEGGGSKDGKDAKSAKGEAKGGGESSSKAEKKSSGESSSATSSKPAGSSSSTGSSSKD